MLKVHDVVNQCYILQEPLGEDAFCERWKATALFSATRFLLRFLKERPGLEALLGEYRRAALDSYSVSSPAVHDFLEVEVSEGRCFVVSEYEGERPLASLGEEEARFPLDFIVRFALELAQGLEAFHSHGLVYRGLDAESVLLGSRAGRLRSIRIQKPGYGPLLGLLDAREPGDLSVLGYVAPEAREGGGDQRSDVYSLGVHLVRFITGRLPYPPSARLAEGASASLRYVANAFRRRGVPEPLVALTLKALRRNPRQRQSDCRELAQGLRDFAEELRRRRLEEGEADPFAELESLNRAGSALGGSEAAQPFDTAAYFRSLAEAPEEAPPPKPVLLFPPRILPEDSGTERIELQELDWQADEDENSVSDYLRQAAASARLLKTVFEPLPGESFSSDYFEEAALHAAPERALPRVGGPAQAPRAAEGPAADYPFGEPSSAEAPPAEGGKPALPTRPEPLAAPPVLAGEGGRRATLEPPPAQPASEEEPARAPEPRPRKGGIEGPTRRPLPPPRQPAPRPPASPEARPERRPEPAPPKAGRPEEAAILELASDRAAGRRGREPASHHSLGIEWRRERVPSAVVVEGMEAAFARAFRGKGAFRFIEEPRSGPAARAIAQALGRFAERGLFVDLGRLGPGADATDFLRAFRAGLARALEGESRASLRLLARRSAARDGLGALRAPPLGSLLYGAEGEEPDPDAAEAAENAAVLAGALSAFGRRKRPFVLALRGGEEVGPSVHAILIELARPAAERPFCGFVFYGKGSPPAWHVLSSAPPGA